MTTIDFKTAVLTTIGHIPKGYVASYGQIASEAGFPGAARAVGTLLSKLPADTKIPWHRVVNAQGKIAFSHASPRHQAQYLRLLEEGVLSPGQHTIAPALFYWNKS